MHEISLVQGLLNQLDSLALEHKATSINKVKVEVGPFAGIVIDSFQFGFDVLAAEHDLTREATLEIVTPPKQYKCCHCGKVAVLESSSTEIACIHCSKTILAPVGGDGLILLQVEME